MASLHKDPRGKSQYWYCAFRLPNGQRAFRSTRTKKRNEAEAICERWQRQASGISEAPVLQNKELVMESFIAVTQQATRNELTEAGARRFVDDLLRATGQSPVRHASARSFLMEWVESKQIAKAKGTADRYRSVIERFLEWIGQRADGPLGSLTPHDIQSFRDEQLRLGKANKTANMAVKTLRVALNLARRQGMIHSNPAEAVDSLSDNTAERGTFTPEQIGALLKIADEEWRGLILVGATCGLRLSDAARLTWTHVHLDEKVIRFRPKKKTSAKVREVEAIILPDLEAYLLTLPVNSKKADAPLFPKLSRKPNTGRTGLSNTFSRLIAKAGIENEPIRESATGAGRRVFRLSFHSFRHTYISLLANMGVAREVRMKLVGHTSNVHDRYTHHDLETLRTALKPFPSFSK